MSVNIPNTNSIQDNPPKGGFPKVPVTRGIRPRGPPGWLIWASILSATVYGFYQIGKSAKSNRSTVKEKREARMAILPFLQAEQDHKDAVMIINRLKWEAEIMKDRKDWIVGVSEK